MAPETRMAITVKIRPPSGKMPKAAPVLLEWIRRA